MKNMILVGLNPAQRINERNARRFRFQAFGPFHMEGMALRGSAVNFSATR